MWEEAITGGYTGRDKIKTQGASKAAEGPLPRSSLGTTRGVSYLDGKVERWEEASPCSPSCQAEDFLLSSKAININSRLKGFYGNL